MADDSIASYDNTNVDAVTFTDLGTQVGNLINAFTTFITNNEGDPDLQTLIDSDAKAIGTISDRIARAQGGDYSPDDSASQAASTIKDLIATVASDIHFGNQQVDSRTLSGQASQLVESVELTGQAMAAGAKAELTNRTQDVKDAIAATKKELEEAAGNLGKKIPSGTEITVIVVAIAVIMLIVLIIAIKVKV